MAGHMNAKRQLLERLCEWCNKARIAPFRNLVSIMCRCTSRPKSPFDFTPKATIWDILSSVCGLYLHEVIVPSETIIDDNISSQRSPSVVQRHHFTGYFILAQQTIAKLIHALLNQPSYSAD